MPGYLPPCVPLYPVSGRSLGDREGVDRGGATKELATELELNWSVIDVLTR